MAKLKNHSQYGDRITELKDARKEVFGMGKDIESIWRQADHDYIPHLIAGGKRKILAKDDDKGWASRFVEIGGKDWQTMNASVNPYIKIQTALSIMVARNPGIELDPDSKKYENSTVLQKELYKKSWERVKSLQQLKLFTFNDAKYGWAAGRTYPYQIKSKSKILTTFDPDNPYFGKKEYETREYNEFSGIMRENLDVWTTWIDDKTRPNAPWTTRDWCFAKPIPYKTLEKQFSKSKNWKFITDSTSADLSGGSGGGISVPKFTDKHMKLPYFYEGLDDDVFSLIVDGVPLVEEPLPIADEKGKKYLSLWHTYWTLRNALSPMGIGINEAIRPDKGLYDKLKNMTVDQIILAIYKMFFYSGTDQLDSEGTIRISPGLGKQISDPQNLKWLDMPSVGKEPQWAIEMQQNAIDEASAITKPLTGQEIGKTAYEAAQASEFSLRRLGTPLGGITDALEQEAKITLVINRMIYSVPEVIKITEPDLIQAYYKEIQGNPELYGRDEQGTFEAKLFPEVQMNLEADNEGRLVESEEARFFRPLPSGLKWEGTVSIKGQSILVETKVLQKQQTLEVFNIIVPLLQLPAELVIKPIKQLLKKYDFDWKDWLPDMWFQPQPQQAQGLFVPQEQAGQQGGGQTMQGQTVLPKNEVSPTNKGLIGQTAGKLGKPAMAFGR